MKKMVQCRIFSGRHALTTRAGSKKNPNQSRWGLVLANITSPIGVLRGKIV
jgi:hypothetical protein